MPYIPHSPADTEAMLKTVGAKHIDDLFAAIPASMRPKSFNLPEGLTEYEVCEYFENVSKKNAQNTLNFLGGGVYNHSIPKALDALSSRGEFYTAYTPYQPEASQGTLQAIFEYQTAVCRLLGMEVANASVYDGGSALFEAGMMAVRTTKREVILVDEGINPLYRTMLKTLTANLPVSLVTIPVQNGKSDEKALTEALNDTVAAVMVQNPSFTGAIHDYTQLCNAAHDKGALTIMVVNPIMQSVIKTAGEMGADIAVSEGQSLGLYLSFGGPYLGILTCKKSIVRQMPGRIAGKTHDVDGKIGYVLTLQAREQHIRRAKATSNICSNQALCALRALIFMTLRGPEGIKRMAELSMLQARKLADKLTTLSGVSLLNDAPYGYEFSVKLPCKATEVTSKMAAKGILAGISLISFYKGLDDVLLIACTETTTDAQIDTFIETMRGVL